MNIRTSYVLVLILLIGLGLVTYAKPVRNLASLHEAQIKLGSHTNIPSKIHATKDVFNDVELESEVLDLPNPPAFVDLDSQATLHTQDTRQGVNTEFSPLEEQRVRLSLNHLTEEVMALTRSVQEARHLQKRALAAAAVSKAQANANSIAPTALGNAGTTSGKPIEVNGQLYVQGRPVPGTTVRSFKDINRGPVGRLRLEIPAPPKINPNALAALPTPAPTAPAATTSYEARKVPPARTGGVRDLSKIKRGPVGRLKLPSVDALRDGLKLYGQAPVQPAGAPGVVGATTTATTTAAPLPPKTRVLKKGMKRGPVGRLNMSALIAQPAAAKPMVNNAATAPSAANPAAALAVKTKLPPRAKTLTKGMKRGPVGRLDMKALEAERQASLALAAKTAAAAAAAAAATGSAVAQPGQTIVTQTPPPPRAKRLTKNMKRGPVGRLQLNTKPTPQQQRFTNHTGSATQPGAAQSASGVAGAAVASPPPPPRAKTLTKNMKRGPVGRLKMLPSTVLAAPTGVPAAQMPVPAGTDPATASQAQALAQAMFRKWVQDFQQKVGGGVKGGATQAVPALVETSSEMSTESSEQVEAASNASEIHDMSQDEM